MEVFFGLTFTSQVPSWIPLLSMALCSFPILALAKLSFSLVFLLDPGRDEVPFAEAVIDFS